MPALVVSPLRGGGVPTAAAVASAAVGPPSVPLPAEPMRTYAEPPSLAAGADAVDEADEPPLPDEARARAAAAAAAATSPVEAGPGAVLHVRFAAAGADRVVAAMEELRRLLRARPGGTRVVVHVPQGPAALPMELRGGVAYDAELLAEVERRVGGDLVHLDLRPAG